MHYSESLRYLNSFLNFERITARPNNRFWNLERMKWLLDTFDHPEKKFFPILIAGTKGKGSTGFFLESALERSGVRTGFYSSPHLEDPRERIRLKGGMISKKEWAGLVSQIEKRLKRKTLPEKFEELTYFEILTLMAILHFQKKKVEIGIFEVGLGGRLDATNILAPRLALLTPVHLDHEAILGNTVAKIAREKAAIIRRQAYVVTSWQSPEALAPIKEQVRKMKAHFYEAKPVDFQVGLEGDFQRTNAGVAGRAAEILRDVFGFKLSETIIRKGLSTIGAGQWPGRFEFFRGRPSFLLDAAHNPASMEAFVRNLKRLYAGRKRILIFSASKDKNSARMLKILSAFFPRLILVPNPTPKTQEMNTLILQARPFFKEIFPSSNVREAVTLAVTLASTLANSLAKKNPGPDALVVATGSFYLLGEVRRMIR